MGITVRRMTNTEQIKDRKERTRVGTSGIMLSGDAFRRLRGDGRVAFYWRRGEWRDAGPLVNRRENCILRKRGWSLPGNKQKTRRKKLEERKELKNERARPEAF